MGISLRARLPEDGIFFAGETFSCILTFTHTPDPVANESSAPRSGEQSAGRSSVASGGKVGLKLDTDTASLQRSSGAALAKRRSQPLLGLGALGAGLLGLRFGGAKAASDGEGHSSSQDDASIGTATEEKTRPTVRKSMSLSALRGKAQMISPVVTASTLSKPSPLGAVMEAEDPLANSSDSSAAPPHISIPTGQAATLSNATTAIPSLQITTPSTFSAKAPRLASVAPPPPPPAAPPELAPPTKPPDATSPSGLLKNPFSEIPARSLSLDIARPTLSELSPSTALANAADDGFDDDSNKDEQSENQQIFLSNVNDDSLPPTSARPLSVVNPTFAEPLAHRPISPDTLASTLPRSQTPVSPFVAPSAPLPDPGGLLFEAPFDDSSPARAAADPRQQTLAWGFAQMMGLVTVDTAYVRTNALEPLKARAMYNVGGAGAGGGGSMGASGLGLEASGKPGEKSYPLYNTPPSILFYDLALSPGESRSFRYSIDLPPSLPPTHRGKIIRFSYKLVVGIQRGGDPARRSQVIQLPFRLFGRVEGDGSKTKYEILSPVIVNREEAIVVPVESDAEEGEKKRSQDPIGDDEEKLTLMQSLILVCQRSGKVSFDICKNNEHVAKLTLQRAAYRLGETIIGILDFSKSAVPCFQVSAFLENFESVDNPFGLKPRAQLSKATRRVFAEQHRYVVNVTRTGISLPIPIGCTPDFMTTAVSLSWVLRLEFITGISSSLLTPGASDINFVHMSVLNHADVEAFDCLIPLKIFPTKTARRAAAKTFEIL
ncbi:hypothetical protein HK101_011265 [Irineochytrium annulatum]|nr:hypothetical protein HK101_011265 [Irineochytrium annulatum]